ncbi:MAG TPA: response regulator [Spirochaetota bacterium]|nr:response regulator [Spirochaetota bacterium]HPV42338.1 response regulator [Spirochaetota bacterium]
MSVDYENRTDERRSVSSEYAIFETLKHPVSIISNDGLIVYGNRAFHEFFHSGSGEIRLDWEHPFFPEYRKRIAQSYLAALHGTEKRCFAIVNSPSGNHLPVEIYLFPMFSGDSIASILALMIIVDDRLLSFDRSTLSIISEENFRYDNLHFEFSPMPILRVNDEMQIIKCSHSLEGFTGYSAEEMLNEKTVTFDTLFGADSDKVKKAVTGLVSGESTFRRIGEARITARDDEKKITNLTLYPIVEDKEITAVEIIMEDITKVKELKDQINAANRIQLFTDITKGFLHSLNNTINVILNKTQLIMQITEKESVAEGIQVMEESALEIAGQVKRIQNFIGSAQESGDDQTEPLVDIIEDAIEFSKMQFKVYNIDNMKTIRVDKKYFSNVLVNTNTRLLREIITSIILKVSNTIHKAGTIVITLRQNHDLHLSVEVAKDTGPSPQAAPPAFVNIFSGIDIRQVAEIIKMKIIEEESPESYAIKAIIPSRILIDREKGEAGESEYRLRDLDIIVVEDEVPLQKILFELFDKMGNRVFICDDGRKAIEEFKRKPYDLIITDYGIPGITGIELSARIKEIREDAITVLLSGWMLDNVKAYKNVVDLFLPKPFKLDELLKKIARILGEKRNK